MAAKQSTGAREQRKGQWTSEDECRRAVHAAAYDEAVVDPRWPIAWKLLLAQDFEKPRAFFAEPGVVASHALNGRRLLEAIDGFLVTEHELSALEKATHEAVAATGAIAAEHRESPLPGLLRQVRDLVELRARFAELQWGAPLGKPGRPSVPARPRVAGRLLAPPFSGEKAVTPTARDLALAMIGAGYIELPPAPRWQTMTAAAIIGWEEKAMRDHLPGARGAKAPGGGARRRKETTA